MHYVIGDIHGFFYEMLDLLKKIEVFDPDPQFVFVGDFIDRGKYSFEVIEWMMQHISEDGKYQAVRGNHEDLFLDY